MGELVYIMGKSGTGKSRSMRNIPKDDFLLINPEGKRPPFGKDAPAFGVKTIVTDNADKIVDLIGTYSHKYKIIVVDDFQTVMTNEFMRRSAEASYQKWTDIGKHAWEIANKVKDGPDDSIVYIMCHTEIDDNGNEKIKTLGKLLDQNVVLESKSAIVLKTAVSDGVYSFCTENNGRDTVKSPEGMFPSYAINNDLKYVDDKIRNYYGLEGSITDEQAAAEDEKAAVPEITKTSGTPGRKKRTRTETQEDNRQQVSQYVNDVADAVVKKGEETGQEIILWEDAIPFADAEQAIDSVPKPEPETTPHRERKRRVIVPEESKVDSSSTMEEKPSETPSDASDDGKLKEDTFFYIPADDNYVKKHAGDTVPEGGQVITEQEFAEGIRRLSQVGMNPPEAPVRRRRRR